jgi:hypothetical protein
MGESMPAMPANKPAGESRRPIGDRRSTRLEPHQSMLAE